MEQGEPIRENSVAHYKLRMERTDSYQQKLKSNIPVKDSILTNSLPEQPEEKIQQQLYQMRKLSHSQLLKGSSGAKQFILRVPSKNF
jgi:hypothetical protein